MRALLIGVDRYPLLPPGSQLQGARNDVEALTKILRRHLGISPHRLECLFNERATRSAIIGAMSRLLGQVDRDEPVLLYFSGHGSRRVIPESSMDDPFEPVIVPHDSGRAPHGNRDIGSRCLAGWLERLAARTTRIALILDCCHAGRTPSVRGRARVRRTVAEDREVELEQAPWPVSPVLEARRGSSGWLPHGGAATLVAASRAYQPAFELELPEVGYRAHGALTYFLVRELASASAGLDLSELISRVSAEVVSRLPDQHPQLERGERQTALDLELPAARPPHLVLGRSGDRIQVGIGSVHGVQNGTLLDLHATELVPPTSGARLGQARVVDVQAVQSEAILFREARAGRIIARTRAIPAAGTDSRSNLRVAVIAPAALADEAAALRLALDESPLLRVVVRKDVAELKVRLAHAEEQVLPVGGCPSDPPARPTVTCLVANGRGRVVAPVRTVQDLPGRCQLVHDLETLASLHRIRTLERPVPTPLDMALRLEILRRTSSGGWRAVRPSSEPGCPVFADGERFAVRINNSSRQPVFPYLLDLGVGGVLDLLYPLDRPWRPIEPGRTVLVGAGIADALFFAVPSGYPFSSPGATPARCTRTLKLIAATEGTDLRPLFLPELREGCDWLEHVATSSLGWTLARILARDLVLNLGTSIPPREVLWTAQQRSVVLERRALPSAHVRPEHQRPGRPMPPDPVIAVNQTS